jgi:predicted ester cyclase
VTGTIRQAIGSGNTVVQEITWKGTHTGELLGPAGAMPPSGKRIAVPASVWYTFQGDQICEIHHHLDMMSMLQQLGAIPAPGAGGT